MEQGYTMNGFKVAVAMIVLSLLAVLALIVLPEYRSPADERRRFALHAISMLQVDLDRARHELSREGKPVLRSFEGVQQSDRGGDRFLVTDKLMRDFRLGYQVYFEDQGDQASYRCFAKDLALSTMFVVDSRCPGRVWAGELSDDALELALMPNAAPLAKGPIWQASE